ncbi:hypothetical protein ACHZ98_29315 [Streptomyces sp. MAR4 CNY-716]
MHCSPLPGSPSTSCHRHGTSPTGAGCWTSSTRPPRRSTGPWNTPPTPVLRPNALSTRPCGHTWPSGRSTARSPPVLARRQQRPPVTLTGEEQHPASEAVHDALRRGELELTDSWYAADRRQITLARLADSSNLPVVALRGDPDTPDCQVIGRYPHDYAAMQALPAPVPAGVLLPDVSRFNRPVPTPEVPLQRLIRDVVEAQEAPAAANAVLSATSSGYEAGSMVRLQELLETASRFAAALQTARGREIAARLAAAGRQLGFLTGEVREAAEDLAATVAVLPPHRTPQPHIGPRPAVQTTAPAAPPPASTPAPRR